MQDLLTRGEIHDRLAAIIPEGTPNRNYCIRMMAADVVFCAIYVDAIDGRNFIGPKHVYRMTEEQSMLIDVADRLVYDKIIRKPGGTPLGTRWYQDNTREPIRDETLREGLIVLGAVTERTDLPTTSSKPKYALTQDFAALFDPALIGSKLNEAMTSWRKKYLNPTVLARIAIVRKGASKAEDQVLVTFPNGETQRMKPGKSSEITRSVIETFAPKFLNEPVVLFVSESGNKVVARHDELAKQIGLNIKVDKNLPDVILADIGASRGTLIVFVEVVATDGPVNERRKAALELLAKEASFPTNQVAYVTAYLDRNAGPFKKNVDSLAWGSYAWFSSEPDFIVEFNNAQKKF